MPKYSLKSAATCTFDRIMAQRQRCNHNHTKKTMRVVQDWSFTWPRGTAADKCDIELTNEDLPRYRNNWIKVDDGAVTFRVNNNVKSVSVQLRNISKDRVSRVVIDDYIKNMCYAVNGSSFLIDGDYGPNK